MSYKNIHGYLRQVFEAFGPELLVPGHRHHPHAVRHGVGGLLIRASD